MGAECDTLGKQADSRGRRVHRTCRKRRMKSSHAAALALVGWYLMIPPSGRDYPMGNVNAPLSQWGKRPTTYRDKEECEHALDRHVRQVNAKNKQVAAKFYKQAQCIASDDPRLKQK